MTNHTVGTNRPHHWDGNALFDHSNVELCQVICLSGARPRQRWRLSWPDGTAEIYSNAGDAHAAIKDALGD